MPIKRAIVDSNFTLGAATLRTGRNISGVFFYSGLLAPLCGIITSSAQPEVHNILRSRQSRTEPRPRVTCTAHVVKFGLTIFEMYERTETNNQTHRLPCMGVTATIHGSPSIRATLFLTVTPTFLVGVFTFLYQ